MKGNFKIGLIVLVAVIVAIALIQAGQKQPINWQKTFKPKDKIPFGIYVIDHELSHIFNNSKSIKFINQSPYVYLTDSFRQQLKPTDFIFIGKIFEPGKPALKSLLSFVHQGNNALLAAYGFPKMLLDTLGIGYEAFNGYQAGVGFKHKKKVYYTLAASPLKAQFDHNNYSYFFDKLNDSTNTILGYLERAKYKFPNFIKVRFGKGQLFIQLNPDIYGNYFMLNPKTYPFAYYSLHYLNGTHILWYNKFYNNDEAQTPMRVVLSHPALRAAWYLLLVTLLIYLIFKGKREQKAIPIVKPEENLSVAFAETIGALYYENDDPGNMVAKKIKYFLFNLRRRYRLPELAIQSTKTRADLATLLSLPVEDVNNFFDKINYYHQLSHPQQSDLRQLQELIENFKQKTDLQ